MSGQRVLILSVGAGSGHNRAAQALHKVFGNDPRVQQTAWIDCLEYTNKAFRDLYSKQFLNLVSKAPTLWGLAFDKTDVPWEQRQFRELLERLNARPLFKRITDFAPSACVCTHFMPGAMISRMLRKDELSCHLSVVVTDFYVHASWLTEPICRYFVAHEEGKAQLEAADFSSDRIDVTGIPIDPVFAQDKDKTALHSQFGLDDMLPIILLSAGAAGTMKGDEIVQFLSTIRTPCQFVIICGRNETLRAELDKAASDLQGHQRFHILGYTTQMDEWMAVADLFIGKPGGLSTSECLARGLPMVVWDPVPGQEVYNTMYLLEHGAAVAPASAATLGFKVDQILQHPDRLAAMKQAARTAGKPNSAAAICDLILQHANESAVEILHKRK
ncbi:MAG: glycosyltransferase [Sedimentisphaerales bacterium]|nr:glycosyltransferase [Sedimentisphaerales bacterium]